MKEWLRIWRHVPFIDDHDLCIQGPSCQGGGGIILLMSFTLNNVSIVLSVYTHNTIGINGWGKRVSYVHTISL